MTREIAMRFANARRGSSLRAAAVGVVFGAQPGLAAAQPATDVHLADAPKAERSQQRAHCNAQLRNLKATAGLANGQSDQAFMKTCLDDVDPVAVLPRSAAVINAPVGSTAVCGDGTYSSAVKAQGACRAHGGVASWFGR
jgi:hypothetical protein